MIRLFIDPSGSFSNSTGTTGLLIDNHGELIPDYVRNDLGQMESYAEVIAKIQTYNPDKVIMESWVDYGDDNKGSFDAAETPELIGIIKWECWKLNTPIKLKRAVDYKPLYSNEKLLEKGLLIKKGNKYVPKCFENASKAILAKINGHNIDCYKMYLHEKEEAKNNEFI